DYKTGSTYGNPKDGALSGGQAVQLPLYMLAAARVLEMKPEHGAAEYHYSTRRGGFKRGRFTGEDFTGRSQDLALLLEEMLSGMRDGIYPMAVRRERDCGFCVANQLCPSNRMRII